MKEYVGLFCEAKSNGLGVTIHTGEEGQVQLKEMELVVEKIEPHRIGHGFLAAHNPKLMKQLVEKHITLELCPTSNIQIRALKNIAEMKRVYRKLYDAGLTLTINTDGPEMHGTNLWKEFNFLLEQKIFTQDELNSFMQNAFNATFIQ
jgi:adenosine deaminase